MIKRGINPAVFLALAFSFFLPAKAETLTIPGSGASEYVLNVLAKAFNSQQTQHRVVVPPTTGTAGALRDIASGKASIGRVGRPLKDSELSAGLTYLPLGRDPVAFVGGSGVTVRNISRDQVLNIYRGKLTNWQDLGGRSGVIRAIGREPTDSSRQAIARGMQAFENIQCAESVKLVHLDTQMIELLDRFPTSLGFLNRSALNAARTRLTLFSLDSVEPTPEKMASGQYLLWTELGLVYKDAALTDAGRSFLSFVESPAGKQLLFSHGIIPAK